MNRDADLRQLLLLLFDIGELRVHLGDEPHGEILSHSLPDGSITPEHFVSAVVQLLKRHGLIDREFFDRLELARVNRVSDIRKVRSKWLENAKLESGEKWADRRYELVSLCGKGGFGIVWEANDTHTGAIVAVKILLEQHADDRRIRQRFFRGAEALKRLSHPAICGVRSSVQQEGQRYFYVMDYIDGSSLASLVGVRPQAELLEYVLQIGEALEHVHQHGLLHRDVKPTNILVAGKQAKLIDFDLVTGDGYTQMTSRALGTVFYAPPEANSGEKKIRAYDVYSLARTVEFVIRGRELNVADQDSLDTLDAKKNVKSVLRTALHVDPKRRTQTAAQFCADLRRALELTDRNTRNRAVSSTARQTPDITPNQQPALASSEIAAEHWTRSYLAWVGGVVGRLGIRVQRAGLVLLAIMAFTVLIFAYTLLSSPLTTPSEKQASTMDDPGAASQLATTTTAPAMAPSVDEITSPGGVTAQPGKETLPEQPVVTQPDNPPEVEQTFPPETKSSNTPKKVGKPKFHSLPLDTRKRQAEAKCFTFVPADRKPKVTVRFDIDDDRKIVNITIGPHDSTYEKCVRVNFTGLAGPSDKVANGQSLTLNLPR